jgi:hypothetical protein
MKPLDRRAFVKEVGAGMLLAGLLPAGFSGLAPGLRSRLGFSPRLQDADDRLDCGRLEPLVRLMQDTPADKIIAVCVEKLRSGTTLEDLTGAAALANARTFGGEDYTGYHCEMALMPAYYMAAQMPDRKLAALPVLKVIQRSSSRIQEHGGRDRDVLRRLPPAAAGVADAATLLTAERALDPKAAEQAFASMSEKEPARAYEALQALVRDNIDVHQVVLAWRAFELEGVAGRDQSLTLLRQSVRKCVDAERVRAKNGPTVPAIRDLLPRILEEHHLTNGLPPGLRLDASTEQKVDALAWKLFGATQEEGARAVAEALASGMLQQTVGEALSLASIRLLLHDPGISADQAGKPKGSVHGASIGVHASDSAMAWRHIADHSRQVGVRTAPFTLVTAGWHTAGQSGAMDRAKPMHADARDRAAKVDLKDVPGALEESVKARDQAGAAALVERVRDAGPGRDSRSLLPQLMVHAVEHDGALHHEKFFWTVFEALQSAPHAFEWKYVAGLARVCASGYGFEAPGLAEARKRLLA